MPIAPRQFGVHRTAGGTLVVVAQSDLLDDVATRVVIPLVEKGRSGRGLRSLNPVIEFAGSSLMLMPQQLATVSVRELSDEIGSAAFARDEITRAVDALLSGV